MASAQRLMRLVIFDLDGTLLTGDTDEYWLRFLIDKGIVDHGAMESRNQDIQTRYAAGVASAEEFCFFYLSLLRGHSRGDLERWHSEFMQSVIVAHLPAAAHALLQKVRDDGGLLVMSTATNRFLAAPIARLLGFEHLIATDPEEDASGGFTGGCIGLPNMRANKILRLNAWLAARGTRLEHFDESWFYSDSRNDLPLLSRVSHPVAVDPDPELARHAKQNGWPVLRVQSTAAAAAAATDPAAVRA
ncbi:MAG: HAD-IB family hydrolase [Betaproteobacteria bacterium]